MYLKKTKYDKNSLQNTAIMSKKFLVFNELDSTNNYANQLLLSKAAEEGTVVLARFQKKGQEQQGNFWESEPNKNLLMSSILLPRFLPAAQQFLISKIVSLALLDFLKTEIADVKIKWPNDIYIKKGKVAGILIETAIKGNFLESAVIGIGLNLNQKAFVSDAPNPVSLHQITHKNYDCIETAKTINKHIFKRYAELQANKVSEINHAYFSSLYGNNEWNRYRSEETEFEGKICGIGEFGQLQLQKKTGEISEFLFKEVELLL